MIDSELCLRLARTTDATAIANMSRELIEYGLGWRWTEQRVAASINAENTNVLVARLDNRVAGFGIMQVLRFAINVVLTRLLDQAVFGVTTLVTLFNTGLHMFSDLGIRQCDIEISTAGGNPREILHNP
jgi:hypothetical protein